MINEEKIKAVLDYLRKEFPQAAIEHRPGERRNGQYFSIKKEGATFQTLVSEDFLIDHETSYIPIKLAKFTLAEHLRDLPRDVVIVTTAGLKLEEE